MSENTNDENTIVSTPSELEPIPFMQRLLDNPFVLLVLGVAVPAVFYLLWGIIEITQIPIAD